MMQRAMIFSLAPTEQRSWAKQVATILGASWIIALFAPVALRLPFTPVPIGFQCHVVLFLAVLLGSKRATAAVMAFLLQGAMGLPFFAGGSSGIVAFLGPRGGYLIGYLFAAFVTGLISEKMKERTPLASLFAMGAGNLVVYACGLPWLSLYVGASAVFMCGFYPFILGDIFKLLLAVKGVSCITHRGLTAR